MSDIEGKKPKAFFKYAKKNKLGFLALEYSGCGKSSGKFLNGTISKWSNDTKILIKRIIKKNDFILIGSSMGAWISLNQFKYYKMQIKGFIGIGSAPEFTEKLMWQKFTKKMKKILVLKKIYNYYKKKDNFTYPITYKLIKDGRKNKILSKKINSKINVTMFHGEKDTSVPISFSKKTLNIFPKAKKKLVIIKNGDHRLSAKKDIKKMKLELDKIISNVV